MVESKWVRLALKHFFPFGHPPTPPPLLFPRLFLGLLHLQVTIAISRLIFKSQRVIKCPPLYGRLFLCIPPPPPLPAFPSHHSGVSAQLAQSAFLSLSDSHNGWVCGGFGALAPRSARPASSEPWPWPVSGQHNGACLLRVDRGRIHGLSSLMCSNCLTSYGNKNECSAKPKQNYMSLNHIFSSIFT